jgi:transposase
MRNSTLFNQMLSVTPPWSVQSVLSDPKTKTVDVRLGHRREASFACPDCGSSLPVYDHVPARSWRHLDCGPFLTFVHARSPRVSCPWHGVRRVDLPWALPRSHFTCAFERWAIDVLLETDVQGATRLLHISWDEAWHLMERAVERGQQRKQRRIIARLGVDEKSIAKGHQYFTLVCDIDRGTVEYVVEDRKRSSLDEYYDSLTVRQRAGIQAVAMDRWEPFIASTKAYIPRGADKIVIDRYHIMVHLGKAVDTVRKQEHKQLTAAGDATLKGTKYLWLYAEENLPERHEERFAALKGMHLQTARSWALKESLRDLWNYQRRGWAEHHWRHWYFWATHSRLPAMIKAARTIRNHLPQVLNYFAHRITNALSEGMNSRIQEIKKTLMAIAIRITLRGPSISTVEVCNSTPRRRVESLLIQKQFWLGKSLICPFVQ